MKKWTKIILVFLSVLCAVWILSLYLKKPSQNKGSIIPSKPNLVQTYNGRPTIYLELKRDQFKYTDRLPFLNISHKIITKDGFASLASYLGFTENPVEINDSQEGLTYFWKKGNSTLFAYAKSVKVRYSSGNSTNTINKQLSDTAVQGEANNLLIQSGILSEASFAPNSVQYLKENVLNEGFKVSTNKDFSLFQVNILPKSLEYEIISPTSTSNTSFVQLTKDGKVYLFQLILFDNVQNGLTDYKLKDYDEIVSSLQSSVLINLQGIESPMENLPSDFVQKIAINEISLAYLLDSPTSTSLQPVYKLSGVAELSEGTKTVPAVLYLPALSGL